MAHDRYGLTLSGAPDAVSNYNQALPKLLRFQPEVVALADAAVAADPTCAMAASLRAYLGLMSSEWPDAKAAEEVVAAAQPVNDRERKHVHAARTWISGNWNGAARILDDILFDSPQDLLALIVGHQLDFFTGDARALRARPERALAAFDPSHEDAPFIRGMRAFGLEESGDYAQAERVGLDAVDRNRDDVWGIHAVVHTYEMQGHVAEGIRFLETRRHDWMEGTFFNVHNAWHLALYRLEAEDHAGALEIYDATLHNERSAGVAIEMLDATSLLWRLHLDGVDVQGRFEPLAAAWAAKDPTPWYVFNDLHAIMAFVGAKRLDDARSRVKMLEDFARGGDPRLTNHQMTSGAGLSTARALLAFGEERFDDCVASLSGVRRHLAMFGGSHAQRDAWQRTCVEAALRGGARALAEALLAERLEAREMSSWTWRRLQRLRTANDAATAKAHADAIAAQARNAYSRP